MLTLTRKLLTAVLVSTLTAVAVSVICHAIGCDDATAEVCIAMGQLAGVVLGLA